MCNYSVKITKHPTKTILITKTINTRYIFLSTRIQLGSKMNRHPCGVNDPINQLYHPLSVSSIVACLIKCTVHTAHCTVGCLENFLCLILPIQFIRHIYIV